MDLIVLTKIYWNRKRGENCKKKKVKKKNLKRGEKNEIDDVVKYLRVVSLRLSIFQSVQTRIRLERQKTKRV